MMHIRKSALYDRQLEAFALGYRDKAGLHIANYFLDNIDDAVEFIGNSPTAFAIEHNLQDIAGLESYEYRKWQIKSFPHSIFFRIEDKSTILLEAIYAHRMDMLSRLPSETTASDH